MIKECFLDLVFAVSGRSSLERVGVKMFFTKYKSLIQKAVKSKQ